MLIVRSPMRISLGGGGTDLPAYYRQHGGFVLSAAINKYFYSVLCRRDDGQIQIISSDLRVSETWSELARLDGRGTRLEIPLAVLKHFGRQASFDLFLASEILPGTGLGSSASVCVNILTIISRHLDIPLSKYELAECAFHIARNILGKPVGKQDEYASAFGGLNLIEFRADESALVRPVDISSQSLRALEERLLLFYTGASHDSWTILKAQEESSHDQGGAGVEALHIIKKLAVRMQAALESEDLESIGPLLHEGWEAKKSISKEISTPRIDRLYQLARESGATGGKITGAGGGGFLLLYCPIQSQATVRAALAEQQIQEMSFRFDHSGARVVTDDPFLDGDRHSGLKWNFTPITRRIAALPGMVAL